MDISKILLNTRAVQLNTEQPKRQPIALLVGKEMAQANAGSVEYPMKIA